LGGFAASHERKLMGPRTGHSFQVQLGDDLLYGKRGHARPLRVCPLRPDADIMQPRATVNTYGLKARLSA
jgi:hypothetical protein